ncbi:MAG: YceI family protein [Deinococcales bacterium]
MKKIFFLLALCLLSLPAFAKTFSLAEGSEARFYIDEVLMGADKTVIGVSNLVTGDIDLDLADPASVSLGVITIDATAFSTDDNRRTNKVHNDILKTRQEEFQFITFEATSIEGMPEALAVGDSFELSITGNLTLVGVTREETFTVNVEVTAEDELTGLGSTTILYKDYELSVPRVPLVARVNDDVKLEISFTAKASE